MPGKMTREEAYAFLDSRPGWIILTTIGRDGFPHSIPIGYFRLGDEVYVGGRAGTQKMLNVERNSKVSLLVESGSSMQNIKGLMIQGHADLVSEPQETLRLMRESMKARGAPDDALPTEPRPGAVYIRVRPEKMISWDYGADAG
jgi:nitroimidazol reductase NimA-like FMN-containing flavoprotein (pyridoxamine 5'-phosphate oxidase superfamily)